MAPKYQNSLHIEWLNTDAFQSFDNQVRKHPASQIRKLVQSIETNGWTVPILVDEQNRIIAGEGRLAAAREIGLSSIPIIRIEHLTEAQVRAYRIADNRLPEDADWIEDQLHIEFTELDTAGIELLSTAFEIGEIDRIKGATKPQEDEEEVAVPVRDRPAVSRIGDQFIVGDHRIVCGDALKPETYEALLNGASVHAMFVDPPYNVRISGHVSGTGRHGEFVQASGEMSPREFASFLGAFLKQTYSVMVPGGTGFVAMDWRSIRCLIEQAGQAGYELANLCVWVKTNPGMGSLYRSQHELIAVTRKPGGPPVNNVQLGKFGRNRSNVWTYPGASSIGSDARQELGDHPTPKPVAMVADAILDVTRPGDEVLDPFGGGGSTLIAAQRTGRVGRIAELDPWYVDVMIRRAQTTFGLTAYCARTGRSFDDLAKVRACSKDVRQRERRAATNQGGSK